jgi:hypothetical protein
MHLVSVQSFLEALALNTCLQDQDQDQDAMLIGGTRRVPKPYYEFDLDCSDSPMLPELDGITLETKKSMIQSFLTIHYSKHNHQHSFHHLMPAGTGTCCGKPKVPVPWSDIMKGQSRFISTIYMPDDTKIMEPSKLLRANANAILEFWWDPHSNSKPGWMTRGKCVLLWLMVNLMVMPMMRVPPPGKESHWQPPLCH